MFNGSTVYNNQGLDNNSYCRIQGYYVLHLKNLGTYIRVSVQIVRKQKQVIHFCIQVILFVFSENNYCRTKCRNRY